MELYTKTAYKLSAQLTSAYSTSFSHSMTLFPAAMRRHIAAIYGLVRIADEIVDTYAGRDQKKLLDELEKETRQALKRGYSPHPIVHAFAQTAREFHIGQDLIRPFFKSMRMDLAPQKYTGKTYAAYIEGSAEVVGLMCLKVFTADSALYKKLEKGARHLGAAYQKVNFLRDIHADAQKLGRWYFPYGSFENFDDALKNRIVRNIERDFQKAQTAAEQLPSSARPAVLLSIAYYQALLAKIRRTPAKRLKQKRIRVSNLHKALIYTRMRVG